MQKEISHHEIEVLMPKIARIEMPRVSSRKRRSMDIEVVNVIGEHPPARAQ